MSIIFNVKLLFFGSNHANYESDLFYELGNLFYFKSICLLANSSEKNIIFDTFSNIQILNINPPYNLQV